MNPFDAAIALAAVVAMIFGFRTGVLRSAATILGYACAAPLAVKAVAFASSAAAGLSSTQNAMTFLAVLVAGGFAISAALRVGIDDMIGTDIGLVDRLAGSTLGVVRVGLIAVTLVLAFDRIIPAGREPGFLAGSTLRPLLSIAGQKGLRSLPPETAAFIDQMKGRQRT